MKKTLLLLVVAAFALSPVMVSSAQAGQGKHAGKHAGKHHRHHGKHHKKA